MVLYETTFSITKKFNEVDVKQHFKDVISVVNRNYGSVLSIQDLGWRRMSQKARLKPQGCFWYSRWFSVAYGANPKVVSEINEVMSKSVSVLRFTTEKICKNRQSLFLSRMGNPNRAAYSLPLNTRIKEC